MRHPTSDDSRLTGTVMGGKYEILGHVGDGGMGRVYRARQRGLERDVALKTLRPDLDHAGDASFYEQRFEAEAALCASLTHPNVVRVFDFGVDKGSFYLVMELLEGRTMDQLMKEGPCHPGFAIHVAKQVAGALAEAHRRGIVHRDIKPSNVMLCPTPETPGFVKLTDFGLAARGSALDLHEIIDPEDDAFVEGTPHYAAPEQIRQGTVDQRADIYGLGAFLLALLSGAHPFEAPSDRDVLRRQLEEDPPPLVAALAGDDPNIPVPLAQLVADCMARDVDERIGDTTDLLRRLDETAEVLVAMGYTGEPSQPHDGTTRHPPDAAELTASRTLVPGMPHEREIGQDTVSIGLFGSLLVGIGLAFALGVWLS